MRHWAAGIGDRNPFWLEAGVAPPTILFALDRIVSGYVGGLPGIHAMYGGTDFRWQRPIRIGDTIVGASVLLDLVEKPSTFARRAIQQIYRTTFRNQAGELVCEADSWCFRTERDTARERGKYGAAEPARYTERELAAIASAYRNEEIRGRTPRYWDEVTVGESLPLVAKGPLTVTSVIAFVQGWGSLYVRAHGDAFAMFERHPALGIQDQRCGARRGFFDADETPAGNAEVAQALSAGGSKIEVFADLGTDPSSLTVAVPIATKDAKS